MEPVLDTVYTDSHVEYAGFWLRFVAAIIDSFIVGIVQVILTFSFYSSMFLSPRSFSNGLPAGIFSYYFLILFINVGYYSIMESGKNQATFGKMALNLKVTDMNGNRITFLNALGRYFAKIISAITLLIGYILAGITEKKQALHDIIASTLVVKK